MRHYVRGVVSITVALAVVVGASLIIVSGAAAQDQAFTEDRQVNQAVANVINGTATADDVSVLEAAQKNDPRNADLAGALAGAYGLVAEDMDDMDLSNKAERMANAAIKMNPQSISAQVAEAGIDVHSPDKNMREKARLKLKSLEGKAPKITKYLRGKSLILGGQEEEGAKLLDASGIKAAKHVKANAKELREHFKKDK